MSAEIDAYLAGIDDGEFRATTTALRALVIETIPEDAEEYVDGGDIGYGWGRGYKGLIFVISAHKSHVNLGLTDGVGLPDPTGLMTGSGKKHGTVRLHTPEDIERPELAHLIRACVEHHLARRAEALAREVE